MEKPKDTQQEFNALYGAIEFRTEAYMTKPYLWAIEGEIQRIKYGKVLAEIEIRSGEVEKMTFIDPKRTWLREKTKACP